MTNITLAIDDKLLEQSREYARKHRTTVNAMVREMLADRVGASRRAAGIEHFLELCKTAGGNSKGWKWNREEIYDRKVLR